MRVQCLDIGNSTTKLGIFEDEYLSRVKHFKTNEVIQNPNLLASVITAGNRDLCYCSVVPVAEEAILKRLSVYTEKIYSVSPDFCAGIPISYDNKKEIGSDRIANAIAAYHTLPLPAVVIDLGTATTFDIISQDGGYEGGIILPGPQGFLDILESSTALLPKIDLSESKIKISAYGKNTKDAMLKGVFSGYKIMIEGIVEELKDHHSKRYGKIPTFVTCGGSNFGFVLEKFKYVENFTLHGLRIAYENDSENLSL